MIDILRRHRRSARRGPVVVVAAALLAPLMVAQPAGAGPAIVGDVGDLAAAATTAIEDHSLDMPRTARTEVTGDFLHKGYNQRAIVESGNLVIYDRDGSVLSTTPTDLYEPTGDDAADFIFPTWADIAKATSLGAIQLAWAPETGFFMAGIRLAQQDHVLYRLPSDGSCAKESCAAASGGWTTRLPVNGMCGPGFGFPCLITTSALAVGMIGTKPVTAVGLSASPTNPLGASVYIVDQTDGTVLGHKDDEALSAETQTTVTALDWDDSDSGLLAIGVLSDTRNVYAQHVSADGTFGNRPYWDVQLGTSEGPLSVAIGHRPDSSPVVAFGLKGGGVKLWDPAVQSPNLLAEFTGSTDAIEALTFTDRFDGIVGVPDLVAAGQQANSAWVLRYDQTTTLKPLPVAPNNGTKTDVGGIRAWFPGYKTGSVQFVNQSTSDDFELDFATRGNAAYGCWLAQDFADRAALPTTEVDVDAGETSAVYALAAYTAGGDGGCAATDFTGQWAAYVTVTPASRPADRTVAKLVMSRSGQLTVQSVGGATRLAATKNTNPADPHPLGAWTIAIQSPDQPTPPTKLTIRPNRLDPAGTIRPVYRIDVPATTWSLPRTTPPRAEVALPPMEARGITSTGADVSLGLLVPQGQPTRATDGSVTLAPVSFYWQNPSVGRQITDIYVQAGSTKSASFNLAGVAVPPVGTTISAVSVCPGTGSTSCDGAADPVANGLDQAPLSIQLHYHPDGDDSDAVLDVTDPAYGQVYYRDAHGQLVTGLIPADGSSYIRVSPFAGAYSNDGNVVPTTNTRTRTATTTVGGWFGYLSTTSTVQQTVHAYVGGSPLSSSDIIVKAINLSPQIQPGSTLTKLYLTGCTDYANSNTCRVANITTTKPGLFLTADPDTQELRIGLQFTNTAQTSLKSLPLQQVAGQPEHTLAAQPLIINNGEVSLKTTSGFQPADTADAWLLTHGIRHPLDAVQVSGGN